MRDGSMGGSFGLLARGASQKKCASSAHIVPAAFLARATIACTAGESGLGCGAWALNGASTSSARASPFNVFDIASDPPASGSLPTDSTVWRRKRLTPELPLPARTAGTHLQARIVSDGRMLCSCIEAMPGIATRDTFDHGSAPVRSQSAGGARCAADRAERDPRREPLEPQPVGDERGPRPSAPLLP